MNDMELLVTESMRLAAIDGLDLLNHPVQEHQQRLSEIARFRADQLISMLCRPQCCCPLDGSGRRTTSPACTVHDYFAERRPQSPTDTLPPGAPQ
jgi:hypothetical protein